MEKMLSSWRENGILSINGAWVLYVCQKQISRWKVTKVPMRLGSRERACFACNECQIEQRCMETIKARAHWSPVYWFSARKRWTELPSKESKPFVLCACFLNHKINLAFDTGEYPFKTRYVIVRKHLQAKIHIRIIKML